MLDVIKEELINFKDELASDRKRLGKVALIAIILLLAVVVRLTNTADSVTIEASPEADSAAVAEMYVDICGAVQKPGVYKVDSGTRLYQVIENAGGLTADADTEAINRAEFVEDGQKITIPELQYVEAEDGDESENKSNNKSNNKTKASNSKTSKKSASSSGAAASGLININTASAEQLKEITGVGDAIAQRIIEYRKTTRFKTIDEIQNVKGIGPATFEKMKDQITC